MSLGSTPRLSIAGTVLPPIEHDRGDRSSVVEIAPVRVQDTRTHHHPDHVAAPPSGRSRHDHAVDTRGREGRDREGLPSAKVVPVTGPVDAVPTLTGGDNDEFAAKSAEATGSETKSWLSVQARLRLTYMFTMTVIILFSIVASHFPGHLPTLYLVSGLLCIGRRLYVYWGKKWQLFLVDYCYFSNAALVAYCFFFRSHTEYFMALFSITHGPLLVAVVLFKNSVVLSDLDKFTSCFIHIAPALVTHVLHWKGVDGFHACSPDDEYNSECNSPRDLLWMWGVPLLTHIAHVIIYSSIVYGCMHKVMKRDEDYLNSFRYMMKTTCLRRLATAVGCGWTMGGYVMGNLVVTIVSLLPTPLMFHYYAINVGALAVAGLAVVWNGSSFVVYQYEKGLKASSIAPRDSSATSRTTGSS